MNEEEKKAFKVINTRTRRLLDELEIEKEDMSDEPKIAYLMQEIRANKTILNLIEKLQKENEEKNKIIDSMIKVMIDSSICDYFIKEKCKNYAGENGKTCDECIKQYFENKAKEILNK